MTASAELAQRLHNTFAEVPAERKDIRLIRGLRWALSAAEEFREARIQCYTHITGFSIPDGKENGEFEYPRLYQTELAFPFSDTEVRMFVAQSLWTAADPQSELVQRSSKLHSFEVGPDPFDSIDIPGLREDAFAQGVLWRNGFFQPDIFSVEGMHGLLDTRNHG